MTSNRIKGLGNTYITIQEPTTAPFYLFKGKSAGKLIMSSARRSVSAGVINEALIRDTYLDGFNDGFISEDFVRFDNDDYRVKESFVKFSDIGENESIRKDLIDYNEYENDRGIADFIQDPLASGKTLLGNYGIRVKETPFLKTDTQTVFFRNNMLPYFRKDSIGEMMNKGIDLRTADLPDIYNDYEDLFAPVGRDTKEERKEQAEIAAIEENLEEELKELELPVQPIAAVPEPSTQVYSLERLIAEDNYDIPQPESLSEGEMYEIDEGDITASASEFPDIIASESVSVLEGSNDASSGSESASQSASSGSSDKEEEGEEEGEDYSFNDKSENGGIKTTKKGYQKILTQIEKLSRENVIKQIKLDILIPDNVGKHDNYPLDSFTDDQLSSFIYAFEKRADELKVPHETFGKTK